MWCISCDIACTITNQKHSAVNAVVTATATAADAKVTFNSIAATTAVTTLLVLLLAATTVTAATAATALFLKQLLLKRCASYTK